MKAAVKEGPGPEGIQVRDVPVPVPETGEALIAVIATGICGTDVHLAHDEYAYEAPVILGHEVLGRVVEVGSDQDQSLIGHKVALETYFSACERCEMCRSGRRNLCPTRKSIGSFRDGGFAEFVKVPVQNLHVLPETPGPLDGVLSEPLACVTHCLLDPPVIQPGDRVLVTGPGAMGHLSAQVAKACGAKVTLAGLPADRDRLAVAEAMGILTTTDSPAEDAFDVVIECSGSQAGAGVALRSAKRGGRYVQVGIFGKEVTIPLDAVLLKELTVTSGFASTPPSWKTAMRLIRDRQVVLTPLITGQVSLDNFTDALQAAERGEGLKTVVLGGGQ